MAFLVRQKVTTYTLDDRRVPPGTPGAVKTTKASKRWYGAGIPGQPKSKRFPLATDKATAQRMLDDMVRRAERGEVWTPDRDGAKTPLADHLEKFAEDLSLGITGSGHRRRKPPADKQVLLTVQRVRDALADCGFKQAADLNADAPTKLARSLRERLALPRTRRPGVRSGISAQSAAFILAAMRRFARWLAYRRLPVRPDLFDSIPGFDPAGNRVHARREVTHAELTRLLTTTAASREKLHGLTGRDRAMLYLLAFSTGFRASELARLRREHIDLDHAIAILPGDPERKATRTVRQPIPDDALVQLRPWLAKRKGLLFPGDWSTNPARMILQPDLAAANVPYCVQTHDGPRYADFHALRHSYLSALAAGGAGVKELQDLARHSDPRLTLGIYTHAREEELAKAANRLKIPG